MAAHFSHAGMSFLTDLRSNNDRAWFQERKDVFEHELKEPMLDLVDEISEAIHDFAPQYVRPSNKAMMRIYRDVRFSKDKSPYKTHLAAAWWKQGNEKTAGASFYLQVAPNGVLVAGGDYQPAPPELRVIREYLLHHHLKLRRILADENLQSHSDSFDGNALTRAPRGFPPEHPAVDLLKCRQWGAASNLPASAALKGDFAGVVVDRFRAFLPLVEFLNVAMSKK